MQQTDFETSACESGGGCRGDHADPEVTQWPTGDMLIGVPQEAKPGLGFPSRAHTGREVDVPRNREPAAIEAEQEIIREAKRLRESGESLPQISKALKAKGMFSRKGTAFHPQTLKRLIDSADERLVVPRVEEK